MPRERASSIRVGEVGAPVGERELEAVGPFVGRDRELDTLLGRAAARARGARRSRARQRRAGPRQDAVARRVPRPGGRRPHRPRAVRAVLGQPAVRRGRVDPSPGRFSSVCMRRRPRPSAGCATRSRLRRPSSSPGCRSSALSSGSSSSRPRRPSLSIRSSRRRSWPGSSLTCSTHWYPTRRWSSSTTSTSWMRRRPS